MHSEVFHTTLAPKVWVLTVEFRKWNFREMTSVVVWAWRIGRVGMKIIWGMMKRKRARWNDNWWWT
jgi:hypothetical protein